MATFNLNGYNSYSGCDIVVTARLNTITGANNNGKEKVYTLGSLQTLSISTHQEKMSVRNIGSVNAIDYTMGQRTIAGSLVFAVFDQHFATEMFKDLEKMTGKSFFLPDELPAMDFTITFANEYGRTSRMALYGVRIINEGQVMSINDLYTENTYQFVANALEPLRKGTLAGSSSDKTKGVQISSIQDNMSNTPVYTGEDLYTLSLVNSNENLKRVLLNVEVNQPTYEDQEGLVKLTISPPQESGTIIIHNQLKDEVEKEIAVYNINTYCYDVLLEQGLYLAWYEDNGKILSNNVVFSVDKIGNYNVNYDDSPIIENITENSIEILSNNFTHTRAVCVNTITNKFFEKDIISRKCTFNSLEANTSYIIYTKLDNSNSKMVRCKTLSDQENYVNSFKSYVKSNTILLSSEIEVYEQMLDKLNDKQDIIYTLSKQENKDIANELIYMAVKFKNEFNKILNEHKFEQIPKKNLENIFGNTVLFNSDALKCNIFKVKNKKEYFAGTKDYPVEVTFSNIISDHAYNVVAICDGNIKSPKYTFYNFNENNKDKLQSIFNKSNELAKIDLTDYISKNNKLSINAIKCLAVKDNKNIDFQVLQAPNVFIDNNNNAIFDVSYKDCLGLKDRQYYICIAELNESLDTTSFRRIKFNDKDEKIFANKYLTSINKYEIFVIWIEDYYYNVISDFTFVSNLEDIKELNNKIIEQQLSDILSNISSIGENKSLDIVYSISPDTSLKNIYYDLANHFITYNIPNLTQSLYELFKYKFEHYYIHKDKYKTVSYDKESRIIQFNINSMDNCQLVNIKFKKNSDCKIEIIKDNSTTLDYEYDYHLLYMINENPIVKSGFAFIDNKNNLYTYNIGEEV